MADVVNLNRFRKNRLRAEKAREAEENRAKYGRTKSEKETAEKTGSGPRTVSGRSQTGCTGSRLLTDRVSLD